jgi:4-amino-4-deoxy-L-arabinose transferase-like glycosyltransferase
MHEGRMDLMASALMILASILLLKSFDITKSSALIKKMIIAGVLVALGLLTSPRVGYSLPFIGLYVLFYFLKNKPSQTLISIFSFLVPLFLTYSIWIFYAFGSYLDFIEFYKENLGYTRLNGYPFYFPKQQIPLLFITFVVTIIGIIRLKKDFFSPLVIWALLHIGSFYLIVYDNGPYASLIFPYLYILLFYQIDESDLKHLNLKNKLLS